MFSYKIISISCSTESAESHNPQVTVIDSFIGPGIAIGNFGLFVGNTLDVYILYYQDSQNKIQLLYLDGPETVKQQIIDPETQHYKYFRRSSRSQAQVDAAFLYKHSPDFRNVIISRQGTQYYEIMSSLAQQTFTNLPLNLSQNSVSHPKFIKNNEILFLSEDKIVKCWNYLKDQESFMVTHCSFPGSKDELDLSTQYLTITPESIHLVGENCLTYTQLKTGEGNKEKISEIISPNIFNDFFTKQLDENEVNSTDIKLITFQFKCKFELNSKALNGYYFQLKKINQYSYFLANELHVTSTYSYYQWRLLNLISQKKFNIQNLTSNQIQDLSYCQLPNGDTLLHVIYKNRNQIEEVFEKVKCNSEIQEIFHIPLFVNVKGKNALDYAIPIYEKVEETILVELVEQILYKKSAEILLQHIALYPFNLFKVNLKLFIPQIIDNEFMGIEQVFDGMIKSPKFLASINRGNVNAVNEIGAEVFQSTEVWPSTIFKDLNLNQEVGANSVLTLKILDIPSILLSEGEQNELMEVLAFTPNSSIFDILAIKVIIEHQWPLARQKAIYNIMVPSFFFILILFFYTLYDLETSFENRQKDSLQILDDQTMLFVMGIIFRMLIYLFLYYFFRIEIAKIRTQRTFYFSQSQNYLKLNPLILLLVAEVMKFANGDYRAIRTVYAATSLLMWCEFLLQFKIFKSMNFLILWIVNVFSDLRDFLFVLFIAFVAFGQAYYIFFLNHNEVVEQLVTNTNGEQEYVLVMKSASQFGSFAEAFQYVYQLAFAQFAVKDFDLYMPFMAWTMFFLATIFFIIVMLNLLISLVGDTSGRVIESQTRIMYQEWARIIFENKHLISPIERGTLCKGKYLMLAIPETETHNEQEVLLNRLDEIKQAIINSEKRAQESQCRQSLENEKILKEIKSFQDRMEIDIQSLQSQIAKL